MVAPAASRAATVAFSSRSERSLQSLRTASRSTSRIVIAGEASISPADSDPIDASMRRRGVLERDQHVVDDAVLDLLVQRAHLSGVRRASSCSTSSTTS